MMKNVLAKVLAMLMAPVFGLALAACSQTEKPDTAATDTAAEKTFTFSLGCGTTEQSVNYFAIKKLGDLLKERSAGRITVNLYPNSLLGGDQVGLEETIAGNITGYFTSFNNLAPYVNDAAVYDLAFEFSSTEKARAVVNEENFLRVMAGKVDAIGLKLFRVMNSRFRITTSTRPIHTIADFKGLKIRVQNNNNHIAFWTAMGANPTPMDFAEVYISLQQGVIDAQENPLDVCMSNKMYEPCKYFADTQHISYNGVIWFSKKVYDSLPADLQDLVAKSIVEATDAAMVEVDANYAQYLQTLKEAGGEYITYDEATFAEFSAMVNQANAAVRSKLSEDILKAYDAAMAK